MQSSDWRKAGAVLYICLCQHLSAIDTHLQHEHNNRPLKVLCALKHEFVRKPNPYGCLHSPRHFARLPLSSGGQGLSLWAFEVLTSASLPSLFLPPHVTIHISLQAFDLFASPRELVARPASGTKFVTFPKVTSEGKTDVGQCTRPVTVE